MQKPDAYYGAIAAGYDASRQVKPKWAAEIEAVREFLDAGPVLDVPLGTGRFVAVYRDKGMDCTGVDISDDMLSIALKKFPGIDARKGSAFDLSFKNDTFATVVCIRFLEWLPLDKALELLRTLNRIAPNLIVSINHGVESHPDAYTYDLGKFLAGIDGLFIEGRRVTANVKGITSEVFKLRPARWSDVLAQFEGDIQRIADKHAGFFGLPSVAVNESTTTVRAEYWSGERLGDLLRCLPSIFMTDKTPRRMDGPLTVLKRDGVEFLLDGRHRANVLMTKPGPHPVLVVESLRTDKP